MRVAMLTNLTASASLPVLQRLAASAEIELAHVYFFDTLSSSRSSPLVVLRQFGWKRIVSKAGETILSKLRIMLGRRLGAKWLVPRTTYEAVVFGQLPWSITANVNHATTLEHLRQLDVDVLLVCVCKNILKSEVLQLEHPQCINIHPSLLPNYRGPTPTFWMLYHGESQTGYTIHRMTEKVDQGEVLAQRPLPLDCQKSELWIELQVFTAAAADLEETLLRFNKRDTASVQAQTTHSGVNVRSDTAHAAVGSYHTYPTPADRRELKKRLVKHLRGELPE